jgi:hypothetical protein
MSNTTTVSPEARRRNLMIVIVLQLVAIVALVTLIFTQVLLDDEPYPCTPTEQAPSVDL